MDEKNPNIHNDPGTYQTGRTQPPKHYSGVVAILLVLVILLSGISTALSIMNFKLYWKLNEQEVTPRLSFSPADNANTPAPATYHEDNNILQEFLGIRGTIIPPVYQRYYKLPKGIYITQVDHSSEAGRKGLLAGDIILTINDTQIQNDDILSQLPEAFESGDTVNLTLYRAGSQFSLSLVWGDD